MAKNKKVTRTPDKVRLQRMAKGSVSILLALSLASPGGMMAGINQSPISLSPVKAAAAENDAGGTGDSEAKTDFTYSIYTEGDTEKAGIVGYTGTDWNLTIPKSLTVEGKEIPVGRISGFSNNENITGLTIEDGATVEIGGNAFQGCPNLKTVSLPSGTTFGVRKKTASSIIHNGSNFEGCASLSELTLGDGITILPEKIFKDCTSLKSVKLPSKLDCFENSAFAGCTSLETLEIPEGVQEMGRAAFEDCTSLTKVAIPSTIKRWCITEHLEYSNHAQIQNDAFKNCTSLAELTLAEGLTVIGYWAFDNTALTSVTVPSTVTELNYTFYNCKKLEEVILQEGALTKIGQNTFANCEALKSIEIPSTVTTLNEAPFLNCKSLKMLVLPPNLKNFNGNSYFDKGCTLEKVFILAEDISVPNLLAFSSASNVYCPADSETYKLYSTKLNSSQKLIALTPDLLFKDLLGVTAEAYQGVYDGKAHPLASVTGQRENEKISYRMIEGGNETGEALSAIPEITEPGTYEMKIAITRMGVEYSKTVQAKISKKTPVLQLEDKTVKEGEDWTISPKEYDGEAEIAYTYYEDEKLEKKCPGKPTAPGIYYIQATAEESDHYEAAKSNGAKLEIQKKDAPPATEKPTPKPQDPMPGKPSPQPTQAPGSSQKVTVKKAKIKKVKSSKKKTLEVRWNKVSKATGYVIWIGQNKKFTKGKKTYTVKSGKTTKKVIRKLKRKKKYFVKIQAYRVVKGKKYRGSFSSVKSCKIK